MDKKTAIVLGATGLTGSYLLDLLLESPGYSAVKVFTRKPVGKQHAKLEEIQCDLLNLEAVSADFTGEEVFCCIGTTKKKTPNKEQYEAIDYGIPVAAAKLAERNGAKSFAVVSALGANIDSRFFYNSVKGKMEKTVLDKQIETILVYRPSFIYGNREETRIGEQIGLCIAKLLQPFLVGKFRKYRAIHARDLAKNIYEYAQHTSGKRIILRDKMSVAIK